ncbi:MAG TPA: PEP-CTERM sorting domain-containing protein [Phenylobacterium sp.]
MVERPSFGLFTADYTPPAGNLCRFDGCEGSNFNLSKTVNGAVVYQAFGSLTPDDVRISAAPEPAIWMVMLGGLGLAGASLRRRARPALA